MSPPRAVIHRLKGHEPLEWGKGSVIEQKQVIKPPAEN